MSAAHRRLELALTVEGGPFEHTGTIIDTLNSENVKVTFFVNALAVPFSQSIRNAFHSGHLIGLQLTESSLKACSNEDDYAQLLLAQSRVIFNCIGQFPKYLRMPRFAESNTDMRLVAERLNFIIAEIDIDVGQDSLREATRIYRARLSKGGKSLVAAHCEQSLQHDVQCLRTVISYVRKWGYELTTIDRLMKKEAYRSTNEDLQSGAPNSLPFHFGTPFDSATPAFQFSVGSSSSASSPSCKSTDLPKALKFHSSVAPPAIASTSNDRLGDSSSSFVFKPSSGPLKSSEADLSKGNLGFQFNTSAAAFSSSGFQFNAQPEEKKSFQFSFPSNHPSLPQNQSSSECAGAAPSFQLSFPLHTNASSTSKNSSSSTLSALSAPKSGFAENSILVTVRLQRVLGQLAVNDLGQLFFGLQLGQRILEYLAGDEEQNLILMDKQVTDLITEIHDVDRVLNNTGNSSEPAQQEFLVDIDALYKCRIQTWDRLKELTGQLEELHTARFKAGQKVAKDLHAIEHFLSVDLIDIVSKFTSDATTKEAVGYENNTPTAAVNVEKSAVLDDINNDENAEHTISPSSAAKKHSNSPAITTGEEHETITEHETRLRTVCKKLHRLWKENAAHSDDLGTALIEFIKESTVQDDRTEQRYIDLFNSIHQRLSTKISAEICALRPHCDWLINKLSASQSIAKRGFEIEPFRQRLQQYLEDRKQYEELREAMLERQRLLGERNQISVFILEAEFKYGVAKLQTGDNTLPVPQPLIDAQQQRGAVEDRIAQLTELLHSDFVIECYPEIYRYLSSTLGNSAGLHRSLRACVNVQSEEQFRRDYEMLRILQQTPLSTLHLARNQLSFELCCVKEFSALYSADCDREILRLAQLKHPLIVPVYGVYKKGLNGYYLVMKHFPGGDLSEWAMKMSELAADGGLESTQISEIMQIFRQLFQAIDFIHAKNVAHLDLKPANILRYSKTTGSDIALCDFTMSRDYSQNNLTLIRTIAVDHHSHDYSAPELMGKTKYNLRDNPFAADMYSVGVMLWQVITGIPTPPAENSDSAGGDGMSHNLRMMFDLALKLTRADPAERPLASQCLLAMLSLDESTPAIREPLSLFLNHLYAERGKLDSRTPVKITCENRGIRAAVLSNRKHYNQSWLWTVDGKLSSTEDVIRSYFSSLIAGSDSHKPLLRCSFDISVADSSSENNVSIDRAMIAGSFLPAALDEYTQQQSDEMSALGIMIAKCLVEGYALPVRFHTVVFQYLVADKTAVLRFLRLHQELGPEVALRLLAEFSPTDASRLSDVYQQRYGQHGDSLLTWAMIGNGFGWQISDAEDRNITDENKTELVISIVQFFLVSSLERSLESIRRGFVESFGLGDFIASVDPMEFALLVNGQTSVQKSQLFSQMNFDGDIDNDQRKVITKRFQRFFDRASSFAFNNFVFRLFGRVNVDVRSARNVFVCLAPSNARLFRFNSENRIVFVPQCSTEQAFNENLKQSLQLAQHEGSADSSTAQPADWSIVLQATRGQIQPGAWYRCGKCHYPYAIGDCGGAVVTAKCPRCGETIGGHNHALTASNINDLTIDRAQAPLEWNAGLPNVVRNKN